MRGGVDNQNESLDVEMDCIGNATRFCPRLFGTHSLWWNTLFSLDWGIVGWAWCYLKLVARPC